MERTAVHRSRGGGTLTWLIFDLSLSWWRFAIENNIPSLSTKQIASPETYRAYEQVAVLESYLSFDGCSSCHSEIKRNAAHVQYAKGHA